MKRILILAAALIGLAAAASAAEWKKLVTPADLAALQAAGDVLVLDIRAPKSAKGAPGYDGGHIPGAVNAPYGWWRGTKTNPGQVLTDAALTDLLRKIGATETRPVVVAHMGADSSDFGAAARVYWTLKSAGIERIAILDGGTKDWWLSGQPLSTEAVAATPSDITATLSDQWRADIDDVRKVVAGEEDAILLDARPTVFFKGEKKHPAAKAAGTLAGAKQLDNLSLFPGGGATVGEAAPLISQIAAAGLLTADKPIVSFCNTGHWAATNWFFASEVAGLGNVKMYAESMVDWTGKGETAVKGE
jgi:thiosulfate/3-mercaptopyruvate sulfurtransferase